MRWSVANAQRSDLVTSASIRQDILLDHQYLGVDLFERPRRGVAIEVAVEVDLVANKSDAGVLWVAFTGIDPGIRHMGFHLAFEERAHARGNTISVDRFIASRKRNALGISQLRVRFGVAIAVPRPAARLARAGESYNLCSGEGHAIFEVLERLVALTGTPVAVDATTRSSERATSTS